MSYHSVGEKQIALKVDLSLFEALEGGLADIAADMIAKRTFRSSSINMSWMVRRCIMAYFNLLPRAEMLEWLLGFIRKHGYASELLPMLQKRNEE